MNLRNFLAELQQRKVYRIAVACAVVTWLLIQIATQVFPFFDVPDWSVRIVVLLVAAGFPIALILAWAFELTPEGIKRTEDVVQPRRASLRVFSRFYTQRAVSLLPASQDPVFGPGMEESLAGVEARVGESEGTIARLERLLITPYGAFPLTHAVLRLDPTWDPLRAHRHFQALVEGPEPKTICR